MSVQAFETEIIANEEITTETKILINELKNKILSLSIYMAAKDSKWDHQAFADDYFDSVLGITTGETK